MPHNYFWGQKMNTHNKHNNREVVKESSQPKDPFMNNENFGCKNFCTVEHINNQKVLLRFPLPEENNHV